MELSEKEASSIDKLSELDQDARYRDPDGRTLTEIQQSKVSYRLNPSREGLMHYDNRIAEKKAKSADPRYFYY